MVMKLIPLKLPSIGVREQNHFITIRLTDINRSIQATTPKINICSRWKRDFKADGIAGHLMRITPNA